MAKGEPVACNAVPAASYHFTVFPVQVADNETPVLLQIVAPAVPDGAETTVFTVTKTSVKALVQLGEPPLSQRTL